MGLMGKDAMLSRYVAIMALTAGLAVPAVGQQEGARSDMLKLSDHIDRVHNLIDEGSEVYGTVLVLGSGLRSCGDFTMFIDLKAQQQTLDRQTAITVAAKLEGAYQWILGFVSAQNQRTATDTSNHDTPNDADIADAVAWLKDWCRENPDKTLYRAGVVLTDVLALRDAGWRFGDPSESRFLRK